MAQIERKTAYESGEHAATASKLTKTGMFFDNIGRTILADPDTAAEFGIALGAAAFTGGTSLMAFAAKAGGTAAASALRAASRSAGLRALTTLTRSRTAAATAANRTRQVGLGARKLGHWTANGLNRVAAGGKIAGNLNPSLRLRTSFSQLCAMSEPSETSLPGELAQLLVGTLRLCVSLRTLDLLALPVRS